MNIIKTFPIDEKFNCRHIRPVDSGGEPPPPSGFMFEMFFLKVIGYKIHTYLPPAFCWGVFGPRVEKNMLKY